MTEKNPSLDEQIEAHLDNIAISKQLRKEHEWCDQQIAEKDREIQRLIDDEMGARSLADGLKRDRNDLAEERDELKAENERLRQALTVYAEKTTFHSVRNGYAIFNSPGPELAAEALKERP